MNRHDRNGTMGDELRQKPIWQPVGPRETLEETLRGRIWLLEVRDEPGELVELRHPPRDPRVVGRNSRQG